MNHEHAVRELFVEKYLLGELTGDARNAFEEHLFECIQCAEDLKAGVLMSEAMRAELAAAPAFSAPARKPSLLIRWLNPLWLAPALAACLAVIAYQRGIQIPRIASHLAQANTPAVLNNLVLAGGASRGEGLPHIIAPQNGSFLLSVDIPPLANATGYRCTLYSPSGKVAWSGAITPEQVRDTVQIHVPTAISEPGENTLVIQAMGASRSSNTMEILTSRKFVLEIRK